MSKAGEIPYTWAEIEAQIKEAILCQASILESFGPWLDGSLVASFIGMSTEEFAQTCVEDLDAIDIRRHELFHHVEWAYRYAYQLDGCWDCPSNVWHEVDGLLQGYPQANANGERSPFCALNDFPLRRVLETFYARFGLFDAAEYGMDLSIRELALLSNMTVPAVRTSLSKEGFKLERVYEKSAYRPDDKAFKLKPDDAKLWLSRRRGFIPQREKPTGDDIAQAVEKALMDQSLSFDQRIVNAFGLRGINIATAAASEEIEQRWLKELVQGWATKPDIPSLRALARLLGATEPQFVADGIKHLLELEASHTGGVD